MKTKSLFIAALVIVSAVSSVAGKDAPRTGMAVVPVKGSEVFKVIYKGENTGKVRLNIYNADAKIVLSETFNSDGFIIPVNFKGLEYGEYTIELVDAAGKKVEKITYAPFKNTRFIHISKITTEENKYLLSVANTASSRIVVKIFDAQNNLIHTETKNIDANFAQVYKLHNTTAGVTFEVSDDAGNSKTLQF